MLHLILLFVLVASSNTPHEDKPTGEVDIASAGTGPFEHKTEDVTDHVHLIYRPDAERVPVEGNVEVIEQSDGLVVVDSGVADISGRDIVAKIKAISKLPVKYLIYTHWHGDHNLGSPAFAAAYPRMQVVSTSATRLHLTDNSEHIDKLAAFARANADAFRLALKRTDLDSELVGRLTEFLRDTPLVVSTYSHASVVLPQITYGDRMTIEDSGSPITLMFLGKANTDGDTIVWLPKQKVLITGDVVVSPVPYGSESYPSSWMDVLKQLDGMDFDFLIPGHGAVERDHLYINKLLALLSDMREQIYPMAKNGASLDEVRKLVDFNKQTEIFCGSSRWRRSEFNGYFLGSMIKNVYQEANGQTILQGEPFF